MKRLIVIAAGIFTLGFLLTFTGAVSYYSNNSNCKNCHEMKQSHDSWQISSHSSVSCTSCHSRNPSEGVFSIERTTIDRLLKHFLKSEKNPKAYVGKANCLRCHSAIKKNIKSNRDSHVVNPHPVHLEAGLNCTHCHKNLVHPKGASTSTRPRMKDCVNCHQSKKASIECLTCHFGTQEHLDKISQAGGYIPKEDEGCNVCHTEKDVDKTDHRKAIINVGGYSGLETCFKCHVYAKKEVEGGVHSKFKTKVTHIKGLEEKRGMGVVAAKPPMWAYQVYTKDGKTKNAGCGMCHVGGSGLPTPEMESQIDCLICHAKNYDMKKRRVISDGGVMKWVGDDSFKAAISVTKPEAEYCWRCHEERMVKHRSTRYEKEADVHAKAGISCQSCHVTIKHKIAKGMVADLMANDIPEIAVSCTSCHVDYKHGLESIDIHLNRIACQTCHLGKIGGVMKLDFTIGVDEDSDGVFKEASVKKQSIKPIFAWFNGTSDKNGFPLGSRSDKKAKIYAFKSLTLVMGVDKETKRPVPYSHAVFAETGDFETAASKAAAVLGLPAPTWIPVEIKAYRQLNHGIVREGLTCDDCHAGKSVMDFKSLGYLGDEVDKLTKPHTVDR